MKLGAQNKYKNCLVKGLKEKFGIEISQDSLNSVLAPDEFLELIYKYKPEDFSLGNRLSPDNKEFFKNVVDGSFRVSLHTHTDFSDGLMTVEDYINQAAIYADKVAAKIDKNDEKPPFLIALTDHDEFLGCCEVLSIISQNPEKYKNLKFVVGGEFGVAIGNYSFDLTALAFNPFDENLNSYFNQLKELRTETTQVLIDSVNALGQTNYALEDLQKIRYKGKNTLINKSGLVYILDSYHVLQGLYREKYGVGNKFEAQIKKLFRNENYLYRDVPKVESIIKMVKNAGGLTAWTHPPRSFLREDDLGWFKNFFVNLKNLGVDGVEANQQYSYKHYADDINNLEAKNEVLRLLAEQYNMFLSGGTDSHNENIFAHHQVIEDELLESFLK